jgi:branched-chain amino acid transport system ATP-binding protein
LIAFDASFSSAGYGALTVIPELRISAEKGRLAVVLGSNGAGKSTALRAIMGLVRTRDRRLIFDGQDLSSCSAALLPRRGVILVPDGARCFTNLTVTENLEGTFVACGGEGRDVMRSRKVEVFDLFPVLAEKSAQLAGTMSGGQRQMLAIGRALMINPRVMLLDEPTAGLAPKIVEEMFEALARIKASQECTIVMAEQNVGFVQHIADNCIVIESGRVAAQGPMREVLSSAAIRQAYLGL